MTQKEQILKLIKEEKNRLVGRRNIFQKYFLSKYDKRWFDGIKYGIENIEDLIKTEIKD
jgi:hypothetical protein